MSESFCNTGVDAWNDGFFSMSDAELLQARAKCFLAWALETREQGDCKAAEYLTALARECLDDAAALDATNGQKSRFDH
jgi:hypothetical protein